MYLAEFRDVAQTSICCNLISISLEICTTIGPRGLDTFAVMCGESPGLRSQESSARGHSLTDHSPVLDGVTIEVHYCD